MARTRTNSSEQKDEGQHADPAVTGNDTSMISAPAPVASPTLSAEDESREINDSIDRSLGVDAGADNVPQSEKISVKTTGQFMLHDPTTGDTIRPEAGEVLKSPFVMEQIEAGRAEEA